MTEPIPPVAERRPSTRVCFGDEVIDDLAWLADAKDAAVRDLLEAENAHTATVLAPLEALREQIFGEIKARTLETDLSVPWRKGAWWYYHRTEEGRSYAIHCRRPDDGTGRAPRAGDEAEQVMLDENVLAEGHDYLAVAVGQVSPDGRLLAYSVDHDGDERYTLHVRDLETGEDRSEAVPDTSYGFAWAADSGTCFYVTVDDTERPWRVHRHEVGAAADGSDDTLVHQEDDARFFVSVGASRSGDFVAVTAGSKLSTEVHLVDAHDPTAPARVVEPRRQDHEYSVAHHGEHLYVLSNDGAPDFAVWRTPLASPGRASWEPVLPALEGVRYDDVETFAGHVIVHLRREGTTGVHVIDLATGAGRDLTFDEPIHTVSPSVNEEFATTRYRFGYTSLRTPGQVHEEDLVTGERRLLKEQPVLGDWDRDDYQSERTWATAEDGTQVPVDLVWRRGTPRNGTAPCLLYGYGAYEISMDPWFSVARLSLLDRGMVFAVAHVRGGGELGRRWYEGGRLLAKPNSFGDFVAAGRHLIAEGWAATDRIVAMGGSAGGLLVGAAVNRAPELFRAVVAEVPFVDALNTILDPDLPLTITEWEEWGNPIEDQDVYRCMRAYSPYENVRPERYPAVLATAGLNDPRVGVHEPAKWVQRLREVTRPDPDRPIVLKTEMGAGHGGPSGRYDAWRHVALLWAFVLDQVGAD